MFEMMALGIALQRAMIDAQRKRLGIVEDALDRMSEGDTPLASMAGRQAKAWKFWARFWGEQP